MTVTVISVSLPKETLDQLNKISILDGRNRSETICKLVNNTYYKNRDIIEEAYRIVEKANKQIRRNSGNLENVVQY